MMRYIGVTVAAISVDSESSTCIHDWTLIGLEATENIETRHTIVSQWDSYNIPILGRVL